MPVHEKVHIERLSGVRWLSGQVMLMLALSGIVQAQVPAAWVPELVKMTSGNGAVAPACTAKMYRSLMPANDYNTYWPPDAAAPNSKIKLYPGVNLSRDVPFGADMKDVIDIFVGEKGPSNNRTVLIYVPGGGGNKIEQQAPESNAFYDNIGRWATENNMVGVTLQRSATNIPVMIDWLKANVTKYKGNPDRMFIWAHSAGNGPLGQYIGRPDLYGIGVVGAIFMSGNPVNFNIGGGGRGDRGGGAAIGAAPGGPPAAGVPAVASARGGRGGAAGTATSGAPPAAGQTAAAPGGRGGGGGDYPCQEVGGMGGLFGTIRGPSSQAADQGRNAATIRQAGIQWDAKQNTWVGKLPDAPGGGGGARGGPGAVPGGPLAPGAAADGAIAGRGARGGGVRGGPAAGGVPAAGDANTQTAFTTADGFRTTRVSMMFAVAQWDGGGAGQPVVNGVPQPNANQRAVHDELCKLEGPKAKDGVGHCPVLFVAKDHTHMSEVFSIGTADKTVSNAVLDFIKAH